MRIGIHSLLTAGGGGSGISGLRRKSARGAARRPEGGAGFRERGQGGEDKGEDGRSVGA